MYIYIYIYTYKIIYLYILLHDFKKNLKINKFKFKKIK